MFLEAADVKEIELGVFARPSNGRTSPVLARTEAALPHSRVAGVLHARTQESARLTPGLCQRPPRDSPRDSFASSALNVAFRTAVNLTARPPKIAGLSTLMFLAAERKQRSEEVTR